MTPTLAQDGSDFVVGDRVLVTGGYASKPAWLANGIGYVGTITEIVGKRAVVKLDAEIELATENNDGWANFGEGSAHEIGRLPTARGQWLALSHGWVEQEWREPIGRLHVGLLETNPDIQNVPLGGGIGAWVESHATMRHLAHDERSN